MSRMLSSKTYKKLCLTFTFIVACICLTVLSSVHTAYAKSLNVTDVTISATVNSDGTIDVTETRTFDFSGGYNGVYWKIPQGFNKANGQNVDVTFRGVTVADKAGTRTLSDEGFGPEYYEVSDLSSAKQLKIYSAHSNETADITISYTLTNVATKWDDTSELYWKFVSDGWETGSNNVVCTINLPVPAGQNPTTGDGTVRAWAHGPLDGSVAISGGTVTCRFPGIGESDFAETRIVFPAEWLSEARGVSGSKLNSILSEEQGFADKANRQRAFARVIVYGFYALAVILAVGGFILMVRMRKKYREVMAPEFTDEYFRDVPSGDHPAVIGMLYRGEEVDSSALTATLMHLSDEKSIRLDKVKVKKSFGREKDDFCLTKLKDAPVSTGKNVTGSMATQAQKIDNAALNLFFKTIASKAGNSDESLMMDDVKKVAKEHAEAFSDAYDRWEDAVKAAYEARFGKDPVPFHGTSTMIIVAAIEFCFVIFGVVAGFSIGIGFLNTLIGVVPAAIVGIAAGLTITGFDRMNRDGIETLAKTKALRNWLLNFTHLKEAIPQDVILWNKLLVMAVALGVSEKVIEQLKVSCPEILEDPRIMPVYGWYYYGDSFGHGNAISAVGSTVASSHTVSTASLASSSNSSGGGFGGGFGGGGGGGGF